MLLNAKNLFLGIDSTMKSEFSLTCPKTGIVLLVQTNSSSLDSVLKFESEYASFQWCIGLGKKELDSLNKNTLSGILLTVYKNFDLILSKDPIEVQNSLLSSASADTLKSLILIGLGFTEKKAKKIPSINISFDSQKTVKSAEEMLMEEYKRIKEILLTMNANRNVEKYSYDENSDEEYEKVYSVIVKSKASKNAIAKNEIQEAKSLAVKSISFLKTALIDGGYEKLFQKYSSILIAKTAYTIDAELREKLILRLTQANMEIGEAFTKEFGHCIRYLQKTNSLVGSSSFVNSIDTLSHSMLEEDIKEHKVETFREKLARKAKERAERALQVEKNNLEGDIFLTQSTFTKED